MKSNNAIKIYHYSIIILVLFLSSCASGINRQIITCKNSTHIDSRIALVSNSICNLIENKKPQFVNNLSQNSKLKNHGIQTFLTTCFRKIDPNTIKITSVKETTLEESISVYAYFDNDRRSMIEAVLTQDIIHGEWKLEDIILLNEYFDYWDKKSI